MTRGTRRAIGVSGLLAGVAGLAIGASTVGAAPAGKADSGTVYFAPTHTVGSIGVYAGDSTDKLLGSGAVVYRLRVLASTKPGTLNIVVKKVTSYFATGSLIGTATGKLTILDSKGNAKITDGILNFAKGTGAQARHTVKGKFSGKGNVNTGQYKITYTGTYR
jgi:hypothetical protein